jgi:hypothetical protein
MVGKGTLEIKLREGMAMGVMFDVRGGLSVVF